ncbi:MAG: hypothetical protein HC914_03070 [Chloroflexaceae bacterium]|nr:hypothetical protein [Chloroflexaceae bacterium]
MTRFPSPRWSEDEVARLRWSQPTMLRLTLMIDPNGFEIAMNTSTWHLPTLEQLVDLGEYLIHTLDTKPTTNIIDNT